jgi:hypothetical protein
MVFPGSPKASCTESHQDWPKVHEQRTFTFKDIDAVVDLCSCRSHEQ